jgi:hypothetical protein
MVLVFLKEDAIRSIAKMAKDDGFASVSLGIQSTSVSPSYEEPAEMAPRLYKVGCALQP